MSNTCSAGADVFTDEPLILLLLLKSATTVLLSVQHVWYSLMNKNSPFFILNVSVYSTLFSGFLNAVKMNSKLLLLLDQGGYAKGKAIKPGQLGDPYGVSTDGVMVFVITGMLNDVLICL